MTKLELLTKIMKDGLDKKIEYPAHIMDLIFLLFDSAKVNDIYTPNVEIAEALSIILDHQVNVIEFDNLIKITQNVPDASCIYIDFETSDTVHNVLGVAHCLSQDRYNNIMPVIIQDNLNIAPYTLFWIPNDMTKQGMKWYMKIYLENGIGWGKKYEGKEKVLTTKVTKKIFEEWKINIVEILKKEEQAKIDYLNSLKNKNEDKK